VVVAAVAVVAGVGPVDGLDVPAIRLVALGDVLAEGDVGVALDGDLVGVVDDRQVAQLLGARDRGGLAADALLQVAVGGDDVDVVVEDRLAVRVRVEDAARPTQSASAGSCRITFWKSR